MTTINLSGCIESGLYRNAVNPPAERIYYAYIQSQLEGTD